MNMYIVYTTEVGQIDADPSLLAAKCSASLPGHYDCYQPSAFAKSSGLTQTVGEEIDFVLQAQCHGSDVRNWQSKNDLQTEEFASRWGFDHWIDHPVEHLSGGWGKFLGLALFTHLNSDIKLYADVTRQLGDRLIQLFFKNLLANRPARIVIFWELDCSRLLQFRSTMSPLYDLGDQVHTTQWVLGHTRYFGDSNFGYGID